MRGSPVVLGRLQQQSAGSLVRRDLFNTLYATPPMFMFTKDIWQKERDHFAASYKQICPLARQLGYDEMLGDGLVQHRPCGSADALEVRRGDCRKFRRCSLSIAGRTYRGGDEESRAGCQVKRLLPLLLLPLAMFGQDLKPADLEAVVSTEMGSFRFEFAPDKAPKHSSNS